MSAGHLDLGFSRPIPLTTSSLEAPKSRDAVLGPRELADLLRVNYETGTA